MIAVPHTLSHWLGKAELAVHSLRRQVQAWRIERRHGALPPRPCQQELGHPNQMARLEDIVRHHCTNGSTIARAHDDASIKLDAAEYAFSSLLEELKGAMTTLPTTWAPERNWAPTAQDVPAAGDIQIAA